MNRLLPLCRSFFLCLSVSLLTACQPPDRAPASPDLRQQLGDMPDSGFARVTSPRPLVFPQDHGAHPAFKNEWWYFTGNLHTREGKDFGYQVTFFRIALAPQFPLSPKTPQAHQEPQAPDEVQPQRTSHWASKQIWMAHAAITDVDAKQHLKRERFARGAAGLAGNTLTPLRVWLDNWQLQATDSGFPWQLSVEDPQFAIHLTLDPAKDIVLNGDQGMSQKSPLAGNASYYYSITRLHSKGELSVNGQQYQVTGLSWLDREWGSSMLDKEQSGWDWFALQFDDGADLMFYQLRYQDGRPHPNSLGSWVDKDSHSRLIKPDEMKLTPLNWWQAPNGSRYPIEWRLDYLSLGKSWRIKALLANQLMDLSVTYWEGAVAVYDADGQTLLGRGYLEMTGY